MRLPVNFILTDYSDVIKYCKIKIKYQKRMKSTILKNNGTVTAFVRLNIQACTACWECLETCPCNVMDKSFLYLSDTLLLKHVLMYDASECSGCLECIKACKFDALSIIES